MTTTTLTKISELRKLLKESDVYPKRSLSQNFMIDANIVNKLLDMSDIQPGDSVLEIGPGAGAITQAILSRKADVVAVERDESFVHFLGKHLPSPNLQVIHDDILNIDLSFLPSGTKVISNLPFHITSPIISKLADYNNLFSNLFLMMQREMADRITAIAPSRQNSSFTLFSNYYFTPQILFTISSNCFFPKPMVDSALVQLTPKTDLPLADPQDYFAFVQSAFQKRRKMLKTTFKDPRVPGILNELEFPETTRPEQLSVEQFLYLYSSLKKD